MASGSVRHFGESKATVEKLRTCHTTLSTLVERTSQVFAPILVFSTCLTFFNQLYGYYYLCIGVFNLEEFLSEKRLGMLASSILWLVEVTVPMVHLFWGCDCTIAESRATKDLLLKLGFLESCSHLHQQVY